MTQKSLSLKLLKVIFKLFYLKSEFVFLLFEEQRLLVVKVLWSLMLYMDSQLHGGQDS